MVKDYKPREVTANRDFPPGWGRNAAPNSSKTEDNAACEKADLEVNESSDIGDPVLYDVQVSGTVNAEVLRNEVYETTDLDGVAEDKSNARKNNMGYAGVNNSHDEIDLCSHEAVRDFPKAENAVRMKNKYRRRKVFAVRDFPKPENAVTVRMKNKYSHRKVFAVRDFPPNTRAYIESPVEIAPISMFQPDIEDSNEDSAGPLEKKICADSPGKSDKGKSSHCAFGSAEDEDRDAGQGSTSAVKSKLKKKKVGSSNLVGATGEEVLGITHLWRKKSQPVARKSTGRGDFSCGSSMKLKAGPSDGGLPPNSPVIKKKRNFGDARNRVRETLRLFNDYCRELLQKEQVPGEECVSKRSGKKLTRIDLLAAKKIKDDGKEVNTEKPILGAVPGVEVGDVFQYRTELALVGIHRPYQAGIDFSKFDGVPFASSIVSSGYGAYNDDTRNADTLVYTGHGGNIVGRCKILEDQKLEKGNLALYNSMKYKKPVRVVRGWRDTIKGTDPLDSRAKLITTYIYDGLYTVEECSDEIKSGKKVYKFTLRRNPGQTELAWEEFKTLQ